ncbi:related to peroxisomal Ca-dependent solute carrier protein [Cephalotrichum gorgonifer]|uniref:Mitochondrial thiamine pyrophosphate carrier 1 n=1 Tax=Cephalotrichum gorgonifer TaxID=2041049 RepID=A0AAE8SY27_9PEZI|nr:related to peroxisomal Ca-dependent solute carrier protein [Cephalotrichum gorgonifer]
MSSRADLLTELRKELRESQNQRDKRIEDLWTTLNPGKADELDLKALQRGLRKIDHPLANADEMLHKIMTKVDTNGDGKIQYDEFRSFMDHTEGHLLGLFRSVDANRDGKLDKRELLEACRRAGVVVPMRRLDGFFRHVDVDNNGYITFNEWRSQSSSAMSAVSYGSPTLPGGLIDRDKAPVGDGNGIRGEGPPEATMAQEHTAPDLAPLQKSPWKLTDFVPDPGYFVAGAIAGGVSRTATAPLDRLKVYLLVNTAPSIREASGAAKGGLTASVLRHPFMVAIKELFAAGGARTFFAGNGLNVIKIMPETAIKFGSYEAAKRALSTLEGHGESKKISAYSKFAAGGVAGMISQFCVYPLDTLKFRLQCETTKGGPKGNALVIQTARKMMAEGGFRTAYRGVTMGLVGMFPYSAIDMGTFEFLKTTYKKSVGRRTNTHPDDVVMGNLVTGVMGASSGAFGATIVYPLNVLRTRLQTQGTVMHKETYTGIVDVAVKTVKREGYRGLYKGLTPNLMKVAPALSITWMVYEKSKRILGLD